MNDDFPILAAIAVADTHPYAVLDHLQKLGVGATRSTVYRRVDALIGEGLLSSRTETGSRGVNRRILSLTDEGATRLATEAAKALQSEPLESPRFGLAVGSAKLLDEGELPGLLKVRAAMAARDLTSEEQLLGREGTGGEPWKQAARERRIAHLKADVQWLQSMLSRTTATATESGRAPVELRARAS